MDGVSAVYTIPRKFTFIQILNQVPAIFNRQIVIEFESSFTAELSNPFVNYFWNNFSLNFD